MDDEKGKGLLIREPINTATLPLSFVHPKLCAAEQLSPASHGHY
jgi:hypothetical protein